MTRIYQRRFHLIAALLCSLILSEAVSAETVAIIVHNDNTTEALSLRDLTKIFRQDKRYWKSRKRIYLVLREANSLERSIIIEHVYKMRGNKDLKNFWITKQFRGELFSFPKILTSDEDIKHFIRRTPNAIGFINASSLDDRVKSIRIDGKSPGEAGYILSDTN